MFMFFTFVVVGTVLFACYKAGVFDGVINNIMNNEGVDDEE